MGKAQECPVCGNMHGNLTLERRSRVPTLQNITIANVSEAVAYPTRELDFQSCSNCSFVWNVAFDSQAILYDDDYNNDVSTSNYYRQHLSDMADRILTSLRTGELLNYVEVGCGEGDFMEILMEKAGSRCVSMTGFDPAFTRADGLQGAVVHKRFFTPDCMDLIPVGTNVVCSRHTIEHVPDTQLFARTISALVTPNAARLFLETPDVNWILENVAFQDFFYEHCSLYNPGSIALLLAVHGMASEVSPVYGGQYMWIEAAVHQTRAVQAKPPKADDKAAVYVRRRNEMISKWSSYISARSQQGPVAIWGAASKGVTFSLLLIDDDAARIDCAIDLNTAKQQRFLPATGMPVVDPSSAMQRGVCTVIIMNPNYESEIKSMASSLGWSPEFAVLNS